MTSQQQNSHPSLAQRCLDLAAGTPVDLTAYEELTRLDPSFNMARLQKLGQAYTQGWLSNVLRRITPFTARNHTDYQLMADLFVTSPSQALKLLNQLSGDLTAFATAAGVVASSSNTPTVLKKHVAMYQSLSQHLSQKFEIESPAPFGSTTLDATAQAAIPFVRSYLAKQAA